MSKPLDTSAVRSRWSGSIEAGNVIGLEVAGLCDYIDAMPKWQDKPVVPGLYYRESPISCGLCLVNQRQIDNWGRNTSTRWFGPIPGADWDVEVNP